MVRPVRPRRLSSLTWSDALLIVEAAWLSASLAIAVRSFALRRVLDGLDRLPTRAYAVPDRDRSARLVEAVSARMPGTTCLTRALVVYGVLRRRGICAEVTLGTRRAGGTIEAHAWLKSGGTVLAGEFAHQSYTPMWRWTSGERNTGGRRA